MRPRKLFRHPVLHLLLLSVIVLTSLGSAAAQQGSRSTMITANGIRLQAGLPLPVFRFNAPQVGPKDTQALGNSFESIGDQTVLQGNYLGKTRLVVSNQSQGTILEQYAATAGFYAYNARDAFSEQPRGIVNSGQAQLLACQFLLTNKLLPQNVITPDTQQCSFDPQKSSPYQVSLAHAAVQGVQGNSAQADQVIGAVVQVPMSINTGAFSQVRSVPLGGPGGHLSLLFRTTNPNDTGFSLDGAVPGLSAVAMPFYGRSFTFVRNVASVEPDAAKRQVIQNVRASYPNATTITVPDPALIYEVDDAAVEQRALEPVLSFEGIQVTDGNTTIVLRDITLPAIEGGASGFGPSVSITAPANGSSYAPGSNVALSGQISGGTAPYSYRWELADGTVLHSGTLASAGQVNHTTNQLPIESHGGSPAATTVYLVVTDADGAERRTLVQLQPSVAPSAFLPLVVRTTASSNSSIGVAAAQDAPIQALASNYSFGVESGSDYPPYGSGGADLPGVVPDAGGFRTSMNSYGWNQRFWWANSSAWERDWRDCGLGGADCSYGVDRADFVYWAGHGSNGGISLPSSRDSNWFPGTNARFQQARWVGMASCLTLRAQWSPASEAPIRGWFNSFQGAHMLLGFNSLMADIAFGPRLVDNMRVPTFIGIEFPWMQRTIREAWVHTAFNMNAGKPAYIYAIGTNGVNPVDNKLPRPSDALLPRPYPVAGWRWVWWDE